MNQETVQKTRLSLKEVAAEIRKQFKAEFPGCTLSVRTEYYANGQSLHLSLMKSDKQIKQTTLSDDAIYNYSSLWNSYTPEQLRHMQGKEYHQLNHHVEEEYNPDVWNNGVFLTEYGHAVVGRIVKIANQYNWDNSDSMIDYFDVNFYVHLNLGTYEKPFIDGVQQ